MNILVSVVLAMPASYALQNQTNDAYWEGVIPDVVLVTYEQSADVPALKQRLLDAGALRVEEPGYASSNFLKAIMPNEERTTSVSFIERAVKLPNVVCADPDGITQADFIPNDTYYNCCQWGLPAINAENGWDITLGDMSLYIAILDQGVDYNHEDLSAHFGGLKGYDFVDNDPDPFPDDPCNNEYHGTHVAGISAAVINNSTGVAGTVNSMLYSVRVLSEAGSGTYSMLINGLNWSAANGASVGNMSLSGSSPSTSLETALNNAYAAGMLLFGSTGNSGGGSIGYPARYAAVCAMGSVDNTLTRSSFSQYGPEMEFVAPGETIASTFPMCNVSGTYVYMGGTSMACPFGTGVAAWYWARMPGWTNDQIRTLMQTAAIDLGAPGWDQFYGYGLVWMETSVGAEELVRTEGLIVTAVSPSKGGVLLALPSAVIAAVELYDGSGRLVSKIEEASGNVELPASSGVYFYRVTSGDEQVIGKAVVTN